jgi:hypothetical protein
MKHQCSFHPTLVAGVRGDAQNVGLALPRNLLTDGDGECQERRILDALQQFLLQQTLHSSVTEGTIQEDSCLGNDLAAFLPNAQ